MDLNLSIYGIWLYYTNLYQLPAFDDSAPAGDWMAQNVDVGSQEM